MCVGWDFFFGENKLAEYAAAEQHRKNAASRLDNIFTVLDGMKNHPLTRVQKKNNGTLIRITNDFMFSDLLFNIGRIDFPNINNLLNSTIPLRLPFQVRR